MPKTNKWSYSEKLNKVVKCKYDCEKEHEHYDGSYEKSLIYFLGTCKIDKKSNGKLSDIIIHHQLSENVMVKTSAELYYILMDACSTDKYWVIENEREKVVLDALNKAKKDFLIHDKEILLDADKEDASKIVKKRFYKQRKWEEYEIYNR